nr:hypothetical protein [Streptomyces sp. RLB1-33]
MQTRMPEEKNVRLVCSLQLVGHGLKCCTPDDVIAVQEQQVITGGVLRACIAYPADADDTLQAHDGHAPVTLSVVIHHVRRALRRLVQDRDDLQIPEGLVQDRTQAALQLTLQVVSRDYDADHWGCAHDHRNIGRQLKA